MSRTRLILLGLALVALGSTYTFVVHDHSPPQVVAQVVVSPTVALSPTPSPTLRASRSRLYVAPSASPYRSPKAVHPSHKSVTIRSRSPQAVHRAVDGALHDITMYCDTGNRTASGKWPEPGMVATISRSIPFGTRVYIEGLGTFTVEDRIGHSSEFDIFTHSCAEARTFGRQHRRVSYR